MGTMGNREERVTMSKLEPSVHHRRFVQRLKIMREAWGMSQEKVAGLMGMKTSSYSDIEALVKRVDLDKIVQLAEFYQVTTGFLLEGERCGLSAQRGQQIDELFNL